MRCINIVLLVGLLPIVQAHDILFHPSGSCDDGSFSGCFDLPVNICCSGTSPAISVTKGPYDFGTVYTGGGCSKTSCTSGGTGTLCCTKGSLTGGSYTSRPRSKRGDSQSGSNCTEIWEANVFGYASSADGTWVIRADHVKDAFAQLHEEYKTVEAHGKLSWLQSHGAIYKVRRHDGPVTYISGDLDA